MKKFLFPALALGLVMTSCQSDEPFAPGMGEEVQATFTISVPDAMGTRAGEVNSAKGGFSNGAGNLNYTVALLNEENKVMYSATSAGNGTSVTFSPTVVQGYTYKILAYATFDSAVEAPTVGQTIADTDAINNIATLKGINDEREDAYFCNGAIVGSAEMAATLKRPFGKLRLVATDYDKLQALGTDVASVKVTYGNDVLMEQKFDTYNQAFEVKDGVKECSASKAAYSEDAANELTVFVDYLPAGQTGETMYPFTIVTTYTNGETYTRTFAQDIPVKRNYLTTLRGNFFTTEAALTLTVDEMFENEETINYVSVSNALQLQEAIENATPGQTTEIILNNDIDLTQSIVFGTSSVIPAPAQTRSGEATAGNFILDLNGKTIVGRVPKSVGHVIEISPGATLKVIGGKISSTAANGGSAIYNAGTLEVDGTTIVGASVRENGDWPSYPVNNYSNMTLKNVTITGYQGAIACSSAGTTTLDNCTINKEYLNTSSHVFYINNADANVVVNSGTYTHKGMDGSLAYVIKGSITVNGGTFSASNGGYGMAALANGSITVNGGTFETKFEDWGGNITLTGGEFAAKPDDKYIAAGYKAIKNGDKYYVVPNEIDAVATTTEELAEVLANSNISTIMLGKGTFEIELYTKYPARESMTIIGTEGTKVKFANQQVRMALFKNFTIKNCEILHMSTKKWGMLVFGGGNKADGVYTVENCLFNGVGTQGIYINEDTAGATYNVKNCTFKGDFGSEGAVVIQNNANLNGEGVVNVTVKENTFNNVTAYKITLLNKENGKLNLDTDVADSEIGKFNR